jgi:hypothetical protein
MSKSLSDSEYTWLTKLRQGADKYWDELTPFEKKFTEEILERFRIYDRQTIVSEKQWLVITRISEKIIP